MMIPTLQMITPPSQMIPPERRLRCKILDNPNMTKPEDGAKHWVKLNSQPVSTLTTFEIKDRVLKGSSIQPFVYIIDDMVDNPFTYTGHEEDLHDVEQLLANGFFTNTDRVLDMLNDKQNKALSLNEDDSEFIQEIIVLDFDNKGTKKITIKEFQNRAMKYGLDYCLLHHSFSSSPRRARFHVFFILKEPIRDIDTRNKIFDILLNIYPELDSNAVHSEQPFYGGTREIDFFPHAELDTEALLDSFDENANFKRKYSNRKARTPRRSKGKSYIYQRKPIISDMLDAIEALDVDLAKEILMKKYNVQCVNQDLLCELTSSYRPSENETMYQTIIERLVRIDMNSFLEINYGYFSCIFDGHEDTNPSASIFQGDDGVYLYKCFVCCGEDNDGKAYTLISLISKLADVDYNKSLTFLFKLFDIDVSFEKSNQIRKSILGEWYTFISNESKKSDSPLCRLFGNDIENVLKILLFFKDKKYQHKYRIAPIADLKKVAQYKSNSDVSNLLALLVLVGIISKHKIDVLPQKTRDDLISNRQERKKAGTLPYCSKDPTVISFSDTSNEIFEEVLKKADKLAKLGINRLYITSSLVSELFGPLTAKEIYPQIKLLTFPVEETKRFMTIANRCFKKYGYFSFSVYKEEGGKMAKKFYTYRSLLLKDDKYYLDFETKKILRREK